MRLAKLISLSAIAALAAMALIGASSASAKLHTALCYVHEIACPEKDLVKEFQMLDTTGVLKTSITTVLCLHTLASISVEDPYLSKLHTVDGVTLPLPLFAHVTAIEWKNCGTGAAHNNCTVTNEQLPLFDILKNELNLGEATALPLSGANIQIRVQCGALINCVYGGPSVSGFVVEGALHQGEKTGHGMFTATELSVPVVSGAFCPKESKWTALFEPVGKHVYLVE